MKAKAFLLAVIVSALFIASVEVPSSTAQGLSCSDLFQFMQANSEKMTDLQRTEWSKEQVGKQVECTGQVEKVGNKFQLGKELIKSGGEDSMLVSIIPPEPFGANGVVYFSASSSAASNMKEGANVVVEGSIARAAIRKLPSGTKYLIILNASTVKIE